MPQVRAAARTSAAPRQDRERSRCVELHADVARLCEERPILESAPELQLGYDAFVEFLARCACIKYGTVEGMEPSGMLEGFLDNILGAKDEVKVIHDATDIPMPERFDPLSVADHMLGEEL